MGWLGLSSAPRDEAGAEDNSPRKEDTRKKPEERVKQQEAGSAPPRPPQGPPCSPLCEALPPVKGQLKDPSSSKPPDHPRRPHPRHLGPPSQSQQAPSFQAPPAHTHLERPRDHNPVPRSDVSVPSWEEGAHEWFRTRRENVSRSQVAKLRPSVQASCLELPVLARPRSAPARRPPRRRGPALRAATVRAAGGVAGQGLPHPRSTVRAPIAMISEEGKGTAPAVRALSLAGSHSRSGLSRWQGPGTQGGMTRRRPHSRPADGETALPRGFIPCGSSARKSRGVRPNICGGWVPPNLPPARAPQGQAGGPPRLLQRPRRSRVPRGERVRKEVRFGPEREPRAPAAGEDRPAGGGGGGGALRSSPRLRGAGPRAAAAPTRLLSGAHVAGSGPSASESRAAPRPQENIRGSGALEARGLFGI